MYRGHPSALLTLGTALVLIAMCMHVLQTWLFGTCISRNTQPIVSRLPRPLVMKTVAALAGITADTTAFNSLHIYVKIA